MYIYRANSDQGSMDSASVVMSDEGFDTDESEYLMQAQRASAARKKTLSYFLTQGWKDACNK